MISTQVVPLSVSILPLRLTNGTNTESFTALPFLVMVQNTQAFSLDWTMRTFGIGLCKLFSLHHQVINSVSQVIDFLISCILNNVQKALSLKAGQALLIHIFLILHLTKMFYCERNFFQVSFKPGHF